jgi:TonB family protein
MILKMTGRILFTLLGLHVACFLFAQNQDTIYFNRTWQETVKDSGYYYRVQYFNEEEKLFYVKDYYPNHGLQMSGKYLSFDPQVRQGKFFWFFSNGQLRQVTEYDHNEVIDVITSFDEQGNMMESIEWADVDTPPEFPGGIENFLNYIDDNLRYPRKAVKNGIQGRVVVSFVLDKEGKPDKIKVRKSVDPMLDKEAIRVIEKSPRWKPAIHHGNLVEMPILIPINFILKKNSYKSFHSN